jgi:hypothetical protein
VREAVSPASASVSQPSAIGWKSTVSSDVLREMVPGLMTGMPARARLGREIQLYNSVHSLLAELARGHQRISEAQLSNYVDGWVGMLTGPMSPATSGLMGPD